MIQDVFDEKCKSIVNDMESEITVLTDSEVRLPKKMVSFLKSFGTMVSHKFLEICAEKNKNILIETNEIAHKETMDKATEKIMNIYHRLLEMFNFYQDGKINVNKFNEEFHLELGLNNFSMHALLETHLPLNFIIFKFIAYTLRLNYSKRFVTLNTSEIWLSLVEWKLIRSEPSLWKIIGDMIQSCQWRTYPVFH